MKTSTQVFGLTKSTGPTEGEAIRYTMTDTGTFAAVSPSTLEYSAWEELSDDEKNAVCADVRSGGFVGFFRKDAS